MLKVSSINKKNVMSKKIIFEILIFLFKYKITKILSCYKSYNNEKFTK